MPEIFNVQFFSLGRFRQSIDFLIIGYPCADYSANSLPFKTGREGISISVNPRKKLFCYCLSYTAVFLNFLPFASVPLVVTVRLLPSADTTM